jgi:hypothetical protein
MSIFIERFLLAILAALAVLLAVTNPMGFSVAARITGVIIIVILADIAAYFSERVQQKRVRAEQSQHDEREVKATPIVAMPAAAAPVPLAVRPEVKETEKEERIFVGESITAEYLVSFFKQQTTVQATNATKDYIGKWIKVTGSVYDVLSTTSDFAQITFERQQSSLLLHMHFSGSWRDRAIILRRGDNITVISQISEITSFALSLG